MLLVTIGNPGIHALWLLGVTSEVTWGYVWQHEIIVMSIWGEASFKTGQAPGHRLLEYRFLFCILTAKSNRQP